MTHVRLGEEEGLNVTTQPKEESDADATSRYERSEEKGEISGPAAANQDDADARRQGRGNWRRYARIFRNGAR